MRYIYKYDLLLYVDNERFKVPSQLRVHGIISIRNIAGKEFKDICF